MAQGMNEAVSRRLKAWFRLLIPQKKAQVLSQALNITEEGSRPESGSKYNRRRLKAWVRLSVPLWRLKTWVRLL